MAESAFIPEGLPTAQELAEYQDAVARDLRGALKLVNDGLKEAVDAGLELHVRVEPPFAGAAPQIVLSMSKRL